MGCGSSSSASAAAGQPTNVYNAAPRPQPPAAAPPKKASDASQNPPPAKPASKPKLESSSDGRQKDTQQAAPQNPSSQQQNGQSSKPAASSSILVIYATQSGNCERLARQLAKNAANHNFTSKVIAIDQLQSPASLCSEKRVVIFITSSYGEGDPPDMATHFWAWLTSNSRPKGSLNALRFALFGCGHSVYATYQSFPKKLFARLQSLGANPVCRRGEADVPSLDNDWDEWEKGLWPAIKKPPSVSALTSPADWEPTPSPNKPTSMASMPSARPSPPAAHQPGPPPGPPSTEGPWRLVPVDVAPVGDAEDTRALQASALSPGETLVWGKVTQNRELQASSSDESTRHVEFELPGPTVYEAGWYLGVVPVTPAKLVKRLAERLGIAQSLDEVVRVEGADVPKDLHGVPRTRRALLTRVIDATKPSPQKFLGALAATAGDAGEKARLERLAGDEGEYKAWLGSERRTPIEVLTEFPSARPALELLVAHLPRLRPALYSIASSHALKPDSIAIAVKVLRYQTPSGKLQEGVTSAFLARLATNDSVPVFVRKSRFVAPTDHKVPLALVATGSGLGPFVGFLQERFVEKSHGSEVGPALLVFGCRRADQDFIYEEELRAFVQDGTLTRLATAFSREGPDKFYVQQRLAEEETARELAALLAHRGGSFLVCGSGKGGMPRAVREAVVGALERFGGEGGAPMGREAAEEYVNEMRASSRYLEDCW
eukprot:tig00020538_g10370.t1